MAVGWYLRFSLSYRHVEELLVERGLDTDHVTVWRWVQRYALELERRFRCELCGGHPVRVESMPISPTNRFKG
jgi:transposase, IS6 family